MDVAKRWLEGNFDPETKGEVLKLRNNDPAGLEDAFYRNLEFGTGGLRGLLGVGTNRMNKYTVGMATQGLANYILSHTDSDDPKVVISYDSRNNSKEFAKITADGRLSISFFRAGSRDGSTQAVDFKALSEPLKLVADRWYKLRVASAGSKR